MATVSTAGFPGMAAAFLTSSWRGIPCSARAFSVSGTAPSDATIRVP
jgi:hypothetical protein